MKFFKTYKNQTKDWDKTLAEIGFKSLKKTLSKCKTQNESHPSLSNLSDQCLVCDGIFFPELLEDMSMVVDCFNKQAQKLLDPPMMATVWSCVGCTGKKIKKDTSLIKEGQNLLIYAMVNAIAFRKIVKKYDKVHNCKKGQVFKSSAQRKHLDILHSPWLCELMAFYLNLWDTADYSLFNSLSLAFDDDKMSIKCDLLGSIKIDIDLSCSICLDIVFDAVALTCGHILCYMCACSAASVTIVDGLKVAAPNKKCPLCRQVRVYEGAIHLDELNILLNRKCSEHWGKRRESERVERVKLVKEHWQSVSRDFLGV